MRNNKIKHFEYNDMLIQYNIDTNIYKRRNNIERLLDTRIDQETIEEYKKSLNFKCISRDKFSEKMNIYYRNIGMVTNHDWVYDNKIYRKMENFSSSEFNFSTNYILGKDVPYHTIPTMEFLGKCIIVYHWGKVYYHTISYNGYNSGQLICPKTLSIVRWAKLKNCSPIMDITSNKIC